MMTLHLNTLEKRVPFIIPFETDTFRSVPFESIHLFLLGSAFAERKPYTLILFHFGIVHSTHAKENRSELYGF